MSDGSWVCAVLVRRCSPPSPLRIAIVGTWELSTARQSTTERFTTDSLNAQRVDSRFSSEGLRPPRPSSPTSRGGRSFFG